MPADNLMEKIVSFVKRKGFIFFSSEIYGGLAGFYDYGPLGVELKNNIKKAWWKEIVQKHDNIVGLDSAIIYNRKVWEASGHIRGFYDMMVDCKKCKKRFREDNSDKRVCKECGGELTEPRPFNLMLKTYVGPLEEKSDETYLRPETAQGIFINFKNILETSRQKLPFGIAQIGKSFRNEITPGNSIFRTREFEQMELEFFVQPQDAEKWHKKWVKERFDWYLNLGIKKENLRTREHEKDELAHYAVSAVDIEYKFPFGFSELEGIANRRDFDLKEHQKASGEDLRYFDETSKERYLPYIIEPSGGVERSLLAFLIDSYHEVKGGRTKTTEAVKDVEVVLKLHYDLAPVKIAILPLVKKEKLVKKAKEIYSMFNDRWMVFYDQVGSIGRRYRRQDEIGTPYCVTVDFDTLEDDTVTVRDRDTMEQERIKTSELGDLFSKKFK